MLLLTVLFACTIDNNVEKIIETDIDYPALVINPDSVNFGIVQPQETQKEVVTLHNEGQAALDIQNIAIEGAAFTAFSDAPLGLLEPGESAEMILSYTPFNTHDSGWLKVTSNDPTDPVSLVPLEGTGAIPLLIIEPAELDMGWVALGESETDGFTLRNGGAADLEITQSLLLGTEFSNPTPLDLPLTLSPGESTWVDIVYTPPSHGIHNGSLWIESNTPAGNSQANIKGLSSEKPVAICDVDPKQIFPHHETATWIGAASYDPSGAAITEYSWTLIEKPEGSEMYMPNGGANRPGFSPDLAGTYIGQLVVHNEYGEESFPCEATLEAIPRESLWVELFWEYSGDDMDLHILRPGGTLNSNNDCYYANCVGNFLDWGVAGYPDDDPSLDIDDIPGTGPENTNILDPESGMFEVYVHDYPGSVRYESNNVTVRIYLSGVLAWEGSKEISGEDSYVHFASVSWPDQEITPR
ncbi:MAG: choice-of-anchor D domain-containing protein [Myxococcota bacterium]|nr:choice-of-anchor D domain-containing protein [Myxococcota bacterium]